MKIYEVCVFLLSRQGIFLQMLARISSKNNILMLKPSSAWKPKKIGNVKKQQVDLNLSCGSKYPNLLPLLFHGPSNGVLGNHGVMSNFHWEKGQIWKVGATRLIDRRIYFPNILCAYFESLTTFCFLPKG